jgi:hypothetical protein
LFSGNTPEIPDEPIGEVIFMTRQLYTSYVGNISGYRSSYSLTPAQDKKAKPIQGTQKTLVQTSSNITGLVELFIEKLQRKYGALVVNKKAGWDVLDEEDFVSFHTPSLENADRLVNILKRERISFQSVPMVRTGEGSASIVLFISREVIKHYLNNNVNPKVDI